MSGPIRPIALGIVRRGREILVFEAFDSAEGQRFHRPLGGEEHRVRAVWVDPGDVTAPLYPDGALELITANAP